MEKGEARLSYVQWSRLSSLGAQRWNSKYLLSSRWIPVRDLQFRLIDGRLLMRERNLFRQWDSPDFNLRVYEGEEFAVRNLSVAISVEHGENRFELSVRGEEFIPPQIHLHPRSCDECLGRGHCRKNTFLSAAARSRTCPATLRWHGQGLADILRRILWSY